MSSFKKSQLQYKHLINQSICLCTFQIWSWCYKAEHGCTDIWSWNFIADFSSWFVFFSLWLFLHWRFKGTKGSALRGDVYILHENGTLEIPVAQKDSTGTYTCVASNKLGMARNEVHLEIKGKAKVIKFFLSVM